MLSSFPEYTFNSCYHPPDQEGEGDVDVVKKRTILFEGEENRVEGRKEGKGVEGARKISVFFASRRLSVPDGSNRYSMNNKNLLQRPCAPIFHPPWSLLDLRPRLYWGENPGRGSEGAHFAHPRRDAPYRRIEEILANKCIINALKRTSTTHDCVYSRAIYLRGAQAAARELPCRNFTNIRASDISVRMMRIIRSRFAKWQLGQIE